jgi:membrane-associated phospholipid phosphatase
VSFPSLHVAGALLVVYLSRGVAWLFWPTLVFNALLVAATPVFGGHFFVDVLAGAAVFWVAAVISRKVCQWLSQQTQFFAIFISMPC